MFGSESIEKNELARDQILNHCKSGTARVPEAKRDDVAALGRDLEILIYGAMARTFQTGMKQFLVVESLLL